LGLPPSFGFETGGLAGTAGLPQKPFTPAATHVRAGLPSPCITTLVPYHNPIPDKKQPTGPSGLFSSWVQAEKLLQIAMMLPSAGFIGWLTGYGLDRWLHQTWMGTAGAIFGILAGLVGVVRMAMASDSKPDYGEKNGNEPDGKDGAP